MQNSSLKTAPSTLSSSLANDAQPLLQKDEKLENGKEMGVQSNFKMSTEKIEWTDDQKGIQLFTETTPSDVDTLKSVTAAESSSSVAENETLLTAKQMKRTSKKTRSRRKRGESDHSSNVSISSFSVSARLKRHDDQCRWYNRKRRRHAPRSREYGSQKKDEEEFLELLEEYKQKKFVLDCVCKRTRWSWLRDLWGIVVNIFRYIRQFVWCCCCPPTLGQCMNKVAFWPPPREYYFFVNSSTESMTSRSNVEPATQHIVRRANPECMLRKDWKFGFEHDCATELYGIECFVTRTETKNHIACVFVRKSRPRYTLLFSHPNGSDISDHLVGLPSLHDAARFLNCNVCSYDYSGYGISEGKPNEKNLYSDINAVYKYLLEDLCIPEANIILWGYSIGTVAAVELARQATKLAGLILLAPVASIIRTLCWRKCCWNRSEPCGRLADCCSDHFNLIKKINEIEMPTLIAHGVQDTIVSVEHGEALYRLCPGAVTPLWIPDVGHNNLENSALLWRRMQNFINKEARPPLDRKNYKSPKKQTRKHAKESKRQNDDKKSLKMIC